jgi:uncharacterized cupredoxin-like copper-binding protein
MRRARSLRGLGWLLLATVAVAAGIVPAATALGSSSGPAAASPRVLGPGPVRVTLGIEHSRFRPAHVFVRPHTTLTFHVVNHDPIGHELIVGDEAVHVRHETGTESAHGAVPGEVSVPPGESTTTTYEFHAPGVVLYACHLPGHFAYGMSGAVMVVPSSSASDVSAEGTR